MLEGPRTWLARRTPGTGCRHRAGSAVPLRQCSSQQAAAAADSHAQAAHGEACSAHEQPVHDDLRTQHPGLSSSPLQPAWPCAALRSGLRELSQESLCTEWGLLRT